ncbi:MAG: lytic transglycosylase domain-containing protein [Rhizomicrobium sp.]
MHNDVRARPVMRDWFSSLLHLALAFAFIPMAVFLALPHKTRGPMTYVVNVITQMVGEAAPPPVGGVFAREEAMSASALIGRWNPLIAEASRRFGVPADWIRAVMQVESGGRTVLAQDRPITSRAGAVGMMQVMPGTYEEMRAQYGLGDDPYDPRDNVFAGTAYLRWLHGKYGFPEMFAAYNGGPGRLEAHLRGEGELPKETRDYVASVTGKLNAPHRATHVAGRLRLGRAAAAP